MKLLTNSYWIIIVSLCLASCNSGKETDFEEGQLKKIPTTTTFDKTKPLPFEKAMITYHFEGSMGGTQVLYFKDYGKTFRFEIHSHNRDIKRDANLIEIHTAQKAVTYDVDEEEGYILSERSRHTLEVCFMDEILQKGVDQTLLAYNYKKVEGIKLGKYDCTVYHNTAEGKDFISFKNLMLMSKHQIDKFSYTLKVTEIDLNALLSDTLFTVPKNITLHSTN